MSFFFIFSFSFIKGKGVYIHAGWMAAGRHAEGKWANGRFLAAEKKKRQMTEDGSCQLDGRVSPNVCQPAGLIAYSL